MDLKPGNKCWVKMKGYPPWPARIDVLPIGVKVPRGKFPVFFYGTHEVSFATAKDIFDFEKFHHKYCSYKGKNAKFNDALIEIDKNPTVFQLGYDIKAIEFLSQFYKFDHQKLVLNESDDKSKSQEPTSPGNRKRQRHDYKTPDINEPKRKLKKIQNNEEKNQNIQSISCNILYKIDEPVNDNRLLHIDELVLQNHNINCDVESHVNNSNLNKFDEPFLQSHISNQVDEPVDLNHILHQTEESILSHKKPLVIQQTDQNLIQPVLQPKNVTVLQAKKTISQSVIEAIKQPALESDSQEIHSEKEKMENIFKKENCEISVVLNDGTENNDLLGNSEISLNTKSENVNIYSNSFKSPIKTSNNERPVRASAQKFKQNFLSYLKNMTSFPKSPSRKSDAVIRTKKDVNKPKKSERKTALTEEKVRIKVEKSSANVSSVSVDFNHNASSVPVDSDNTISCKEEDDLRIISKLSIIDKEIKKSLIVGQENYEICRKMMKNLLELKNLRLILLCRVPEIIVTIRKCRRYKKEDSIKSSACKIFQIFSQIYEQAELEEKVSAGTELLKRHPGEYKTAQVLFNELFVIEKRQFVKQTAVPSLVLSSPSSAQSFHSSANNTPLLINETSVDTPELGLSLDPDLTDINELLKNGVLVLIDSYSSDESEHKRNSKNSQECRLYSDEIDLYKQLGV